MSDVSGEIIFDLSRLDLCIRCGQCMAVCPTSAIRIEGLSYGKELFGLTMNASKPEHFFDLIKSRRSVRAFHPNPLPHRLLREIVEAICYAPMGFPPHKTEVTVVERREVIERALPIMMNIYEELANWMSNPVKRFFVRRSVKPDVFNTMKNYMVPWIRRTLPMMRDGKTDMITRGAPALIIFHADRGSENHTEDGLIALAYGLLAAHSLGLGATAIGLIPPAIEKNKELRAIFNIPGRNEVVASMIVGYPRHEYMRGIKRELAAVTWI
jgi:nitroreductase